VAPTERDGHSLSGQVHVSSAICFAEGMTAYLYAHKVRIFATTRFFAKPYRDRLRENAERLAKESGIEIQHTARGTSAKRIWSKSSWLSAGDNRGWRPSFLRWILVPLTIVAQQADRENLPEAQ